MKLVNIKALFLSCAALIGLSACTNSSSDLTIEQILGQCLTYSKDINTNAQNFNRISFSAEFNYTNYTVDLIITGLELPQAGSSTGIQFPKMELTGLPWAYDKDGWKVIDTESIKPSIVGINDVPVFKKFHFMLLDIFEGDQYKPGIIYDFTVEFGSGDNKSETDVVGCCMTGKTVSKAPDGSEYCPEYSQTNDKSKPIYWVDFDFDKSKADIYLFNAKFLGNMPSLNLVFPDVPFTVSGGIFSFVSDALTPEYNGVPYPSFPISQLKATLDFKEGMKLTFHCNFRGSDYSVEFDGKY